MGRDDDKTELSRLLEKTQDQGRPEAVANPADTRRLVSRAFTVAA